MSFVTALIASTALSATIHVDASAPPGGDGSRWSAALQSLHAALAASAAGDEVRVADGTYHPTTGSDRAATFLIPGGVSILGGFAGLGAADPDQRDIAMFPTILSGNIGSPTSAADNAWHVVTSSLAGPGTLVEGVTIRDGAATGGGDALSTKGGGVLHIGGSGGPIFRHCIVRDNLSSTGGAGAYNTGSLVFESCTFTLNTDEPINAGAGGGILSVGGALVVDGCTFTHNIGDDAGHGLACDGGSLVLTDSVFDDHNAFTGSGGAIRVSNCAATIVGCTFSDSMAGNGGLDKGGGAFVSGGTLLLVSCTFNGNHSHDGGGLAIQGGDGHAITNCDFIGNFCGGDGGGAALATHARVVGCRFEENIAGWSTGNGSGGQGGGVAVLGSGTVFDVAVTFVDCDFVGNAAQVALGVNPADSPGGGLFAGDRASVAGCRFLGNTARRGGGLFADEASGGVDVASCEFSGNGATVSGGGVFNESTQVALRNCTLVGNTVPAAGSGGGVVAWGINPVTRLRNCVLWGNTAGAQSTLAAQLSDQGGGTPDVDFCIVHGLAGGQTLGGEGNSGADPLLTMPGGADGIAGTDDDDLSPLAMSPAIDSGANPLVGADIADADDDGDTVEFMPRDVTGAPRFADTTMRDTGCPGPGAAVDRGAHEAAGVVGAPTTGDLDGDEAVSSRDLGMLLANWGPCGAACCTGDLDGNGAVNLADLAALLELQWSIDGGGAR